MNNLEKNNVELMVGVLIVVCVLILYLVHQYEGFTSKKSNPCTDYLNDNEFLEHMIPHHQVAVDMSDLLLPITTNPIMKNICRKISWQQKYEIAMMHAVLNKLPVVVSSKVAMDKKYQKTKLGYYKPTESAAKDGECNPLFFKPNEHMKHMGHMKLTDKKYLEHMIPHHQVAVDMCKRLLLHTKNIHMISMCNDIIREQQYEILQMNQMLIQWEGWQYNSELLTK